MKNFAIKLTWTTTIYVAVFMIMCQTKLFSPLIIGMNLFGLFLTLFLFYVVLHDKEFKTTKKFKDLYGDYSKKEFDK
jgi:protein-S-isoprenylcysteine O-methyltransferase Ste14